MFFELLLVSVKNFFDNTPDFNFASLTTRKVLLNAISCFLKKSLAEASCLIKKYSSCNEELYGTSQNASSINSIADQLRKSYSAYSVNRGK